MNSIVDTDVISWAARFGMKSRVVCIHHQKIFKDITSEDVMRVLFNFRTMEWWIIQPCNALCRNVPWLLPSHGGGWGRVQLLPRDKAVDQWMMHGWMITILFYFCNTTLCFNNDIQWQVWLEMICWAAHWSHLQRLLFWLLPALNKLSSRSSDWRNTGNDFSFATCRLALEGWLDSMDLLLGASTLEFCRIWPNVSRVLIKTVWNSTCDFYQQSELYKRALSTDNHTGWYHITTW